MYMFGIESGRGGLSDIMLESIRRGTGGNVEDVGMLDPERDMSSKRGR